MVQRGFMPQQRISGPMMVGGMTPTLVKGPLPIQVCQVQQPMMYQQPMMQQRMIMPGSQVQNMGTNVQDYQISPYVTERHITQQTKKIIRKTRKPVTKQVGTKMVPTVEEVLVQNPDTMKMSTEYAEPYIKRDGYQVDNIGTINQKTKVIRNMNG